ncbi:uncharacterized protein LOC110997838 [Pieris rapae]|uniref:uncharacterized protein LOC110997838 n=1 Tax=Pieris rapae TaxID=64459 RepID=UPI001E27D095|nr:uncharacterized protein LOC110997838 [Pieris rapae]
MDMETVEKLIESVRGHIFLYDVCHPQYKNASLKSAIWESIGKELNESGEAVRSKWKTVRDGYTKYKKQLRSSTGSSRKNISYTWASQLEFLDSFYAQRASSSNDSIDYTQLFPLTKTLTLDSDKSQSTSSSSQVPPSQALLPESPATPTASTSRVFYRNKRRSSEIRRNDVGRVLQFLNAKKQKEHDVIDNLFLSYADTFKKFPPREQAIVKLELAKLFSNTELQLLNSQNNSSITQK